MNVVGRVGSLIQQGVYSVATPFHPFGGAVDIIVVQQQDGSFRSTPWYVQFGKFQGVLKGAEKMVRININGIEADFHMYLDNSGEAYFVREGDLCQGSEKNRVSTDEREGVLEHSLSVDNSQCNINNDDVENYRLQSTLSDPGLLRDDLSDVCRFYDFQDDQSFEGELSPEYGSSRYDNLDAVDNFMEAQGVDSEMVLVSVDGHILTAPISSTEQTTENVQLVTPQFHLGPGEGNGFCEGEEEFTVGESTWDSEYINDADASSCKLDSVMDSREDNNTWSCENLAEKCKFENHGRQDQVIDGLNQLGVSDDKINDFHAYEACKEDECARNISLLEVCEDYEKDDGHGDDKGDIHELEIVEEDGNHGVENVHQDQDADSIKNQGRGLYLPSDVEDTSPSVRSEKFKSCLDLTIVTVDEQSEDEDSLTEVGAEDSSVVEKNVHASTSAEAANVSESALNDINVNGSPEVKRDDDLSPSASDFPASISFPTLSSQVSEYVDEVRAGIGDSDYDCTSTVNASLRKDEQVSPLVDTNKSSVGRDASETESNRSEVLNPQTRSSSVQGQEDFSTIEISLCSHLLRPGMGSDAADGTFNAHRISKEEFETNAESVIKNENLVIRYKGKYFTWDQAAPLVLGMATFGLDLSIKFKDAIPVEQQVTPKPGENDPGSASGRRWRLWPIPFRRVKTVQHSNSSSSEEVFVDPETASQNLSIDQTPRSETGTPRSATSVKSPHKKIVRTNIPTNEQIESLNLKEGQNDVTFSFSTRVLGLQQVEAHIYLWKWNARIVISDVDGTITKSDVLGQFMPLVGKDWSQSGVARLFSAIKENGYQLLFLSARAIVQAYLTKSFLFNLKQDGKTLPNGPVVISPNGLFPSLFREVIRRAPHEFKIACLEDIKALFPPDYNPFYAGFGNRDTDELTYRKIGIPKGKIFIINPKGEVAINHRIDVKSYTSLHTLVNDMFPPTSMVEQEDYNSWNYWKTPLPDIDD